MNDQPNRLIDHNDRFVDVNHMKVHSWIWNEPVLDIIIFGNFDLDPITGSHPLGTSIDRLVVVAQLAFKNQSRNGTSA
jgi:hypothetical protein